MTCLAVVRDEGCDDDAALLTLRLLLTLMMQLCAGSPFQCIVIDPNSVSATWEAVRLCPAKQPAQLDLDLKAMSPSELDAKVTGL